jgi:hypothetical protein
MFRPGCRKEYHASLTIRTGLAGDRLWVHRRWRLADLSAPDAPASPAVATAETLSLRATPGYARPLLRWLRAARRAPHPGTPQEPASLNDRERLPESAWLPHARTSAFPCTHRVTYPEQEHIHYVLCLLWHIVKRGKSSRHCVPALQTGPPGQMWTPLGTTHHGVLLLSLWPSVYATR